jgi:hypothetical protein
MRKALGWLIVAVCITSCVILIHAAMSGAFTQVILTFVGVVAFICLFTFGVWLTLD